MGGFGNLAGEIDIWDLEKKKLVGSGKSYCGVKVDWLPRGEHFMTATVFDRLKVDNCVKIFGYQGEEISKVEF